MYDFSGQYAAVTGGAKGIGAAIVKRFLDDGIAGVALLDMDEKLAQETAQSLDPSGQRVFPAKCDVSDEADVASAFAAIFDRFGQVDILVNNAGITRDAMFHKMTIDQFKKVMDVHLAGCFLCCKQVVPGMRERSFGKIVNISSISAFGNVGQANYAAAKAGIIGFTKTLALELGRKNINVNAIQPHFVATDIIKTIPEDILKARIEEIPMKRIGQPEEIASVVAFLSSSDASFISGQSLVVSGGYHT